MLDGMFDAMVHGMFDGVFDGLPAIVNHVGLGGCDVCSALPTWVLRTIAINEHHNINCKEIYIDEYSNKLCDDHKDHMCYVQQRASTLVGLFPLTMTQMMTVHYRLL